MRKYELCVGLSALVILASTFYVNHYMPHGTYFDTGDVNCANDGRGPCTEDYKEDLRTVNIPGWAKFLRENGTFIGIGLLFYAVVLHTKSFKSDDST